jgi:hypothetical protein
MTAATELRTEIAGKLLAQREALADEMVERIRDGVGEFEDFDGPELWGAVRLSCLANLEVGLSQLEGGMALPEGAPPGAQELALVTARLDLPLEALLRAYRVGHAMIWRRWFDLAGGWETEEETRREVIASASGYLFDYVDLLSNYVTVEYTTERDRLVRSREQRRTQLVRDVLEGEDPDPAEALGALDYDLRLEHLALVVSAPEPEAVVRDLARALDASHRLVVSLTRDTAWAWLGRARPFALPERVPHPAGSRVALGEPASGTVGFRRSHREARDAHRVLPGAEGVVRYDEVALESLAIGDEARAREFAAQELEGIDGPDPRSARLRETLRAYFVTGQNASAAAAMLGVHEHTVSYRLRTIEDRLGRPVASRAAELEMALRLASLWDSHKESG